MRLHARATLLGLVTLLALGTAWAPADAAPTKRSAPVVDDLEEEEDDARIEPAPVVTERAAPTYGRYDEEPEVDWSRLDWRAWGFVRSFELHYGEGGGINGLGDFRAVTFNARQDLFHVLGLRLGAFGFIPRAGLPTGELPGFGLRGDLLASTGGLFPGVQPYAGVGGQYFSAQSNGALQMVSRQGFVIGVRALLFQAESRFDLYPAPGGSLFGGLFLPL